jgi:hypothetical protein
MPHGLARILSIIFQPLLLSSYGLLILMNTDTWISYTIFPQLRNALYIIVIASTFFLPALTVLMFLKRGTITTLEMKERTERNWPYISTLLFYCAGWFLLNKLPLPRVFGNMVMGAGLAILVAFIVNLRWKISIHMMGLGGLAGMFFAIATVFGIDMSVPLIAIMTAAGFTGTARLALDAHTPAQVYVGFLTGFFIEWTFVYLYNLWPYLSGVSV